MSAKFILVLCAQTLMIQFTLSQCAGRVNLGTGPASYGLYSPFAPGLGASVCGGPALGFGCNGIGYDNAIGNGLAYGAGLGYGAGFGNGAGLGCGSGLAIEVIPTSGGALPVTSCSPIAPTGLTVSSENIFEGIVLVIGELPFVSGVGLEGTVPSGGAGGINYSCGNGFTAIESIAPSAAGYGHGVGAYGPGLAGIAPLSIGSAGCNGAYGPAAGIVAPTCGCYQDGIYY